MKDISNKITYGSYPKLMNFRFKLECNGNGELSWVFGGCKSLNLFRSSIRRDYNIRYMDIRYLYVV